MLCSSELRDHSEQLQHSQVQDLGEQFAHFFAILLVCDRGQALGGLDQGFTRRQVDVDPT